MVPCSITIMEENAACKWLNMCFLDYWLVIPAADLSEQVRRLQLK